MNAKTLLVQSLAVTTLFASGQLLAANVTNQQVVEHYADVAHAVFADSLTTAQQLEKKVEQFLSAPSAAKLEEVKQAWLDARVPYQQSEVFRFGNAVVDDWEGQLNAWPLDEGLIDYVSTDYQYELGNEGAKANIVANTTLKIGASQLDVSVITPELIAELNEVGGSEANVASGYHAIEFLLWGQDLNGTNAGAGQRAYTDFWSAQEKGNYRQELLAQSAENGLRKMLFGMGSLSLGELNSTEDEHDCFSDNTHNSHYYNEQGIYNVYTGIYKRVDGSLLTGPSLHDLVAQQDKNAAKEIQAQFDTTRAQVGKLVTSAEKQNQHFDQLIAAGNAQGNALVNETIMSLVAQTSAIERAAKIVGIDSLNPDTADHEF